MEGGAKFKINQLTNPINPRLKCIGDPTMLRKPSKSSKFDVFLIFGNYFLRPWANLIHLYKCFELTNMPTLNGCKLECMGKA